MEEHAAASKAQRSLGLIKVLVRVHGLLHLCLDEVGPEIALIGHDNEGDTQEVCQGQQHLLAKPHVFEFLVHITTWKWRKQSLLGASVHPGNKHYLDHTLTQRHTQRRPILFQKSFLLKRYSS